MDPKQKKLTIEELQNAKTPEDIKKLLETGHFSEEIPDMKIPELKTELDMGDSILVRPKQAKKSKVITQRFDADDEDEDAPVERTPDDISGKFTSKAGKVSVQFETGGRFSLPDTAFFSDYSIQDINDITLSREEDMFENIVIILNKLHDNNFHVEDMLLEEFYEVLVGMKMQFNTKMHTHRWICKCQNDVPDNQKKLSEVEIDLESLKYISIEECDENIREHFRKIFADLPHDKFKAYLRSKYGEDREDISIDDELETIQVTDSMVIKDEENTYVFRFSRVKDLIKGLKMAQKKFNWLIRKERNKSIVPDSDEALSIRSEAIDRLENEKAKYTILATRALSLVSVNGREVKSDEEKTAIFPKIKRSTLMKLASISDRIKFGIQDERDLQCNLCGNVERRLLQRTISPIELLPVDDINKPSSSRKLGLDSGLDIYFGV